MKCPHAALPYNYEWTFIMRDTSKFLGRFHNLKVRHRGKFSLESLKFVLGALFYLQNLECISDKNWLNLSSFQGQSNTYQELLGT